MMEEAEDPVAKATSAARGDDAAGSRSADQWLSQARSLLPTALDKAREAKGYAGRWKNIVSMLERLPPCLSALSSHPFFAKNALCSEQLQSVYGTLTEAIELAGRCGNTEAPPRAGKLQMQSDLDSLMGKLDLNLKDCGLLIRTEVLGDVTLPHPSAASAEPEASEGATAESSQPNVRELMARLQIGHAEAKHRALDGVLEAMKDDEKSVVTALSRRNVSALVQLLTATSPKVRDKAATAICTLAESGRCENLLVSEGVLPPLVRLAESGSRVGREKAVVSLQRLSASAETVLCVVGHGGIAPLVELCRTGDAAVQAAAACALKNLSAVPEVRQSLAEEGVIREMTNLLDNGILLGSKEYAAECLQNLTASNESLRRAVVAEGTVRSLLAYLDGASPQESAVGAVRNLVGSVSSERLVSMGILPRLVHVLKTGSPGAKQATASAICKISTTSEMKKLVGECGCVPLLVTLLEAKAVGATRAIAAQAISILMSYPQNAREIKKDSRSVPSLVQLLDHSPKNTAKKYAVSCLLLLSTSKKCRRQMVSYGAIGYLKKLREMDIPGSKKLLERLERGKLRSLFSRK